MTCLSSSNNRSGRLFAPATLEGNWFEERCQDVEGTHVGVLGPTGTIEARTHKFKREYESEIGTLCGDNYLTLPRRLRHPRPVSKRIIADYGDRHYDTTLKDLYEKPMTELRESAIKPFPLKTAPSQRRERLPTLHFGTYSNTDAKRVGTAAEKCSAGFGGVLPEHPEAHERAYFDTTSRTDYAVGQGDDVPNAAGMPTDPTAKFAPMPSAMPSSWGAHRTERRTTTHEKMFALKSRVAVFFEGHELRKASPRLGLLDEQPKKSGRGDDDRYRRTQPIQLPSQLSANGLGGSGASFVAAAGGDGNSGGNTARRTTVSRPQRDDYLRTGMQVWRSE